MDCLGHSVDEIVGMKSYLDGAVIQAGYEELSFDRTILMEEMALPVLLASAQGWPTVRSHVQRYQGRYRDAYARHHSSYQREASHLSVSLKDSGLELYALSLLNSITELGDPVGTELVQGYSILEQRIGRCDVTFLDMSLGENPRCAECQMAHVEEPPTEELRVFLRHLERALAKQNRRLSHALVERILHDQVDQRLENFLKIVQASDLSGLSNTLDNELTLFIRQLLRNP